MLCWVRMTNDQNGGHRPRRGSRFANHAVKVKNFYLALIYAYKRLHRRPPAEADMQRYFCVSPPSVHQMVVTLERAGFIRRQPGVARSIEILFDPEQLPVLL